MGMFKGFQQVGGFQTTVRPIMMFPPFVDTSYGEVGNLGGIPSSNLVAWFNPSVNVTQSGGAVSSWKDTSGTYTWSGGSGTQQPTLVQGDPVYNGRPYFTTDGVHQYFNMAASVGLSLQANRTWQVIIVAKYNNVSGNVRLVQSDISPNKGTYVVNENSGTSQEVIYINDAGSTIVTTSTVNIDTKIHVYGHEIDRQTAGLQYLSIDNTWRNVSSAIGNSSANYAAGQLWIGINGTLTAFTQLNIYDIFFYNQLLSQQDYIVLVNYIRGFYNF
ncbi:MAG TPA: hypothetical protein VK890_13645 [Bacteroidia bacterium]|jgi:hypothetical protein|nr:hypothetical protein [Bacteroidia bacterium]